MGEKEKHEKLWREMMARSFDPRQWFDEGDWPDVYFEGATIMWVYKQTESGLWQAGFYAPDKQWYPDKDYSTRDEAAARVSYLNGGGQNESAETLEMSVPGFMA